MLLTLRENRASVPVSPRDGARDKACQGRGLHVDVDMQKSIFALMEWELGGTGFFMRGVQHGRFDAKMDALTALCDRW
jgi:hypothetical protein